MAYRHGGEILKASLTASLTPDKIIDFSVSVNPRPLTEKTRAAIKRAVNEVSAYPDTANTGLKEVIAKEYGIKAENIQPGNGSTELIYLIAQAISLEKISAKKNPVETSYSKKALPAAALPKRRALIVEPAFSEYRRALEINRFHVSEFYLSGDFHLNTEELLAVTLAGDFDLLFVANPANPTGLLTNKESMLGLARGLEGSSTILVLDEAFIDFADKASIIREVAELKNTILLRSLTKFFSMAGLRLGFIAAHNTNIEPVASIQPPWSVNSIASAAAIAILEEQAFKDETKKWLKTARTEMTRELEAIEGLRVYPSAANFLMAEITIPGVTASALQERLLKEEGFLIRDLTNFNGLGTRFFRVAIKEHTENLRLSAALKGMLKPTAL